VSGLEKGLVMPKKGEQLTAGQIGLLRAWIDQGAHWPDEMAEAKPPDKPDWWSFKPAVRPALPEVKSKKWARNPIDLFILSKLRPKAWHYRDYVIRSFNHDKPYGRFVEEQLAGDVLFPEEPEGVVALGFIAAGPWDFVGHRELSIEKTDGLIARYNDRDDMVMTAMSTFESLTAHCARCHDHKFDPISQKDYYNLQAVFAGVDRHDRPFDSDKKVHVQRR